MSNKCLICNKKLIIKNRKFCSYECYWINLKIKMKNNKRGFKTNSIPWNKGTKGLMKSWLKGKHIKINNALEKWRKEGGQSWNKGKKCPQLSGENQWQWNNGKVIHTKGYILLLKKEHPFSNKAGYIFEHRLIMEKHIGRYLNPEEIVHHKNNNPIDNRIENLYLCKNNKEHRKFHKFTHTPEPQV